MYLQASEVKERIKLYFQGKVDAGIKEVDIVDCSAELQELVDSIPGEDWISTERELPSDDRIVLVIVNGKYGNIHFSDAIETGRYYSDGWLLDAYPQIGNPKVSYWMEIPDGPENGEG